MYIILVFILFSFASCASNRPVATTHTERIEEKMMPIPVGADTIEIVLSHTDDLSHTDLTDLTENLSPTDDTDCSDYNSSFSSIRSLTSSKIARRIDTDFNAGAATASSVLSVGSVRNKNSVRNNNSAGVKSVSICRATLAQQESESLNPDGKKSFQSVQSVGDEKSRSEKKSVHSVYSVRNKNSVRISSTRGVNISRHETDTTSTLRITLRPDTVFVPYAHHIRSDTIVVPDRICKMKLQKMQMANALLILIIIVATIIFFVKDRMTR